MMKRKYDVIYSIGENCGCALYLRDNYLRVASGPMDWLCNATFEQRLKCIENKFRDFFVQKNFVKQDKVGCVHDHYLNIKCNLCFIHDFVIDEPLDKTFPIVVEKYKRRIDRFYNNIKTKDRVLLVYLAKQNICSDDIIKKSCNSLCKKLNKNIDFLIILHNENQPDVIEQQLATNITKFTLHINRNCLHKEKKLNRIFNKYQIDVPMYKYIYRQLRVFLSKIICPFLFFNKRLKDKVKKSLRKLIY